MASRPQLEPGIAEAGSFGGPLHGASSMSTPTRTTAQAAMRMSTTVVSAMVSGLSPWRWFGTSPPEGAAAAAAAPATAATGSAAAAGDAAAPGTAAGQGEGGAGADTQQQQQPLEEAEVELSGLNLSFGEVAEVDGQYQVSQLFGCSVGVRHSRALAPPPPLHPLRRGHFIATLRLCLPRRAPNSQQPQSCREHHHFLMRVIVIVLWLCKLGRDEEGPV